MCPSIRCSFLSPAQWKEIVFYSISRRLIPRQGTPPTAVLLFLPAQRCEFPRFRRFTGEIQEMSSETEEGIGKPDWHNQNWPMTRRSKSKWLPEVDLPVRFSPVPNGANIA
jgi:hypothetical protein